MSSLQPRSASLLLPVAAFVAALAAFVPWQDSRAEDRTSRTVDKLDLSMSAEIDREVESMWQEKGLKPSPLSEDAEFLRRVTLDLTGSIPGPDEVVAFLKDRRADKRTRKIDELIARESYGEHFGIVWMQILMGNDLVARAAGGGKIHPWLVDAFNQNMPYDRFVRELLTAEGVTSDVGPTSFMLRFDMQMGAIEAAAITSRLFLGVQIQCAQCHNHPYEKWTQDQFHQTAAFFARLRRSRLMDGDGKRQGFVVREDLRGSYNMPDTTPPRRMEPIYLTGEKGDARPGVNLRKEFSTWMTDRENPWFARMIVNRYWALFMGRGLVDPIDDFGESNPPTHPDLLNKLASDFVAKGYDLKYLCRVIANSRAYQLSSVPNASNQEDKKYYSHFRLRPLSPEQLLNSLVTASGLSDQGTRMNREQLAALRLQILQRFVFVFGNDEGEEAVSFEGTIPQALMMLNGKLSNDAIRAASDLNVDRILEEISQPALRIEAMFLTALGRHPTSEETKFYAAYAQKYANVRVPEGNDQSVQGLNRLNQGGPGRGDGGARRKEPVARRGKNIPGAVAYEDVFWALLNSTEFRFNH